MQEDLFAIPVNNKHSIRLRPRGNLHGSAATTGRKHAVHSDLNWQSIGALGAAGDLFLLELCLMLQPVDLLRLGECSKLLYALTSFEEVWQNQVAVNLPEATAIEYQGCWKATFAHHASQGRARPSSGEPMQLGTLYSDLWFRSCLCKNMPLKEAWLASSNIDKRSNLSLEEFRRCYEEPNKPVVITDVVTTWPAFADWSEEYLSRLCGDYKFNAGGFSFTMQGYQQYANTHKDDNALYLFDKSCFKAIPALEDAFQVPEYFRDDHFAYLEEERPDYRWIIIGPARSGSSFHKDPNCTSAWNAVIRGKKRWIMFPPNVTPPGVHASKDGADVATPIALYEWFMDFYPLCKGASEVTVNEGDVIFVPRGWWHLVINLEPSIAITQNFIPRSSLSRVLYFLDAKRHLISGLPHHKRGALYEKFVKVLEARCPEALRAAQEERNRWFGASKLAKLLALAEPIDCEIACRPRSESDEYTQAKQAAESTAAGETAQPALEATAPAPSKPTEQATFSFSFSFS